VLQFIRTTMTKRTIASSPRTIETMAVKREPSPKGRPHRRCGPENLGVPGAFIAFRIKVPESRWRWRQSQFRLSEKVFCNMRHDTSIPATGLDSPVALRATLNELAANFAGRIVMAQLVCASQRSAVCVTLACRHDRLGARVYGIETSAPLRATRNGSSRQIAGT
jgi:hypothetical protein